MVMQYLVNRNEEYLRHIELFTESVERIIERLAILEYNIKEVQVILKNLPIDESKDIYRVDMKKADLFWGGAKETVYRRIRYLLGKEPIYRTYDWKEAKKNAVYYESIPLSEGSKRQFFGTKNIEGEREG